MSIQGWLESIISSQGGKVETIWNKEKNIKITIQKKI